MPYCAHILLTGNTAFKLANFRRGLIIRLIGEGHRVSVLAPQDEYVEILERLGCDFIPLKMRRNGTSPMGEARLLLSIYSAIRELRPDVVFSFTIKNNIYCGIACQYLRVPFVPNVTGLGPSFSEVGLLNQTVRLLYRIAFRNVHSVFFQNDSDLRTFSETNLVSERRAKLLPGSGVNLTTFKSEELPDSGNKTRFILVARLLWDKGIGVYAEASEIVRKRYPEAKFGVLGAFDSDSRTGISKEQITAWVSEGKIEYLGSTKDVRPYLESADCIVLPSYYREGTPRTLLEGAAVGRPLITTNMPGCRDLVASGENGFIIQPKDAKGLARACERFIELTFQQRKEMGRRSREIAVGKYDENLVITEYLTVLSTVLDDATLTGK